MTQAFIEEGYDGERTLVVKEVTTLVFGGDDDDEE